MQFRIAGTLLVNMAFEDGCKNKSALFILLIFHSKKIAKIEPFIRLTTL